MSTTLSPYATPPSASSSSTSLPSTTSKAPAKSKPVNVFSNDGSFLERFQRSRQEEDKQKAEEALAKKRQFADRFKTRGKRPPPPHDSPRAVMSIDLDPNPAKRAKLDDAPPSSEYQKEVRDQAGRILKDTGTGVRPLVK